MTFSSTLHLSIVENLTLARRQVVYFLSLLLCLYCSPLTGAEPGTDTTGKLQQVILAEWQRLGSSENAEVSFPALSGGFSLPDCATEPALNFVRHLQPGRNGVEVSCSDPFWQQFLAFELHVFAPVVVLQEALPADTELRPEHLQAVILDTSELNQGYFTEPEDLAGMQTKRPLRTGTPLSEDMVRPVNLIERGQTVKVLLNKPGISIVVEGVALSDGYAGERIRVRNLTSGKTLYAEVVSSQVVRIQ